MAAGTLCLVEPSGTDRQFRFVQGKLELGPGSRLNEPLPLRPRGPYRPGQFLSVLAAAPDLCQTGRMTPVRLLPLAFLLAASLQVRAASAACPQFYPGGQPPALVNQKLESRTTLLCNNAYAVLASGVTHGALWSAEHPTAASLEAARGTERVNDFHPEERLPFADQAQVEDYRRSGYDRGHMTPSGDMPDAAAQDQSFSLANMVPQTPQLNRGIWEGVESAVRHLAEREGELFLVTGPAFIGQELKSIGPVSLGVECSPLVGAEYSPLRCACGVWPG